jgi:DNA polymerase
MFEDEWVYDIYDKGHLEQRKLYGGKLLENISQALAGELCKEAIERAEGAGVDCVGQVHDEVLAISPVSRAKTDLASLISAMESPAPWWPALKLGCEAGAGPNWLAAKP